MGIFQIFCESLYSPSFYRTLPGRSFLMKTIIPEAIETFPAELTVTIENGEARSNVEEPYFIEFPEKLEMLGDRDSDRRLAVVDTRNEFTPERFREYNAYVWLGRTSLIFGDENGEIRIRELRDFPDIVLNRETLRVLGAKAEESYGWLVPRPIFVFLSLVGVPILPFLFTAVSVAIVWANLQPEITSPLPA